MLNNKKIILASASPRRRELLAGLDLEFSIEPLKDEKEAYSIDLPWKKVPEFIAKHKSESFHRNLEDNEILITADTLVFLPRCGKMEILSKPKSREEALEMISELSGNIHHVLTGVCVKSVDKTIIFTDSTEVEISSLSQDEISYYVDKYKPYDKAGAYGVQEWLGYAAIGNIKGSFYNVMGLPVQKLYEALKLFS